MTAAPPSRASFLGLPAELRNYIYELALPRPSPASSIFRSLNGTKIHAPPLPHLLQICQQITAEASRLYYHTMTLRILLQGAHAPVPSAKKFSAWMGVVAPHLEHVKGVEVVALWCRNKIPQFRAEVEKVSVGEEWVDVVRGKAIVRLGYLAMWEGSVKGYVWVGELFGEE